MCHRHESRSKPQQWVRVIVILAIMLFASAIPGHTWRGGGHGGGGHGFHGGHGGHGGHGFRGGHGFHRGGHGWGGVGVAIGVGPYWGSYWGPYGYPYAYPYVYPYTYPTQVYVQPSQQLSIQAPSSPPVWYYCDDPQGYYPYVQQCPGGWRTVTPSPQ
jgi:hypothetical protein